MTFEKALNKYKEYDSIILYCNLGLELVKLKIIRNEYYVLNSIDKNDQDIKNWLVEYAELYNPT